jgi:large subunit ribosomal protein L6
MSRIGQNPVVVPFGVTVDIAGQQFTAKGKQGELSLTLVDVIGLTREDDKLWVKQRDESRFAQTMWGTSRSLIQNIVTGVNEGFSRNLEIHGVGYRAAVQGESLVLQLGYSKEIVFPIPDGITIACERPTMIAISGADRQKVGQVAANIRGFRKPEPYKGKGIRYVNEQILRKEGKKK